MRTLMAFRFLAFTLALGLLGCAAEPAEQAPKQESKKEASTPPSPVKKVEVAKNVHVEFQGSQRRVVINAYVCLRQGMLEQFMTRKRTKEHEAILAADIDASKVHLALLAAGAEAGKPVEFQPKFKPASGTPIKVYVEYKDKNDKVVRLPAQHWIRDLKSKKEMAHDWVFAGSHLFDDPLDKTRPPYYTANDGDVICVSNFETAMLDLPVDSSQGNSELAFEAWTERIPAVGHPVRVILEPVLPAKKK